MARKREREKYSGLARGEAWEAFWAWLKREKMRKLPGNSGSVSLIDAAPDAMEDVAEYFAGLEPRDLASCWVAVVVAAARHWQGGYDRGELGALSRALVVVSRRLHGYRVELDEAVGREGLEKGGKDQVPAGMLAPEAGDGEPRPGRAREGAAGRAAGGKTRSLG